MVHSDSSSFVRVGGMQLKSETRHCQQHGDYTACSHKPGIWSASEQCQEAGDAQQRQASMHQQRQVQQAALWKKRLGRAAMPARFAERSLIFCGSVGSDKTHLAMDRLREGDGKAVVFDWKSYRRLV